MLMKVHYPLLNFLIQDVEFNHQNLKVSKTQKLLIVILSLKSSNSLFPQ